MKWNGSNKKLKIQSNQEQKCEEKIHKSAPWGKKKLQNKERKELSFPSKFSRIELLSFYNLISNTILNDDDYYWDYIYDNHISLNCASC